MVHQRQGLALGLEAGHDLLGVHALLDDLQGDRAADGLGLLGLEDLAHAALADHADQVVGPDAVRLVGQAVAAAAGVAGGGAGRPDRVAARHDGPIRIRQGAARRDGAVHVVVVRSDDGPVVVGHAWFPARLCGRPRQTDPPRRFPESAG